MGVASSDEGGGKRKLNGTGRDGSSHARGFSEEDKAKMMGMIEAMQTRDRCVDETRRDERRGEGYTKRMDGGNDEL